MELQDNIKYGNHWCYMLHCTFYGSADCVTDCGRSKRIGAIILHIGLSLLIYRAITSSKRGIAVLAYRIHFVVDFIAVACAAVLPIYALEACIFVLAIGTLVLSLKLNQQELNCKRS